MSKIFVTSDFHFNHNNILHFEEKRKRFKTIEAHDEFIIKQCNEQAKENDIIIHVGDFFFKTPTKGWRDYYKQFNAKLILIEGNHDRGNNVRTDCFSMTKRFMGLRINFVHRPCDMKEDTDLNLVGHGHSAYKFVAFENKKGINVGIDITNFKLKTLNYWCELTKKTDWEKIKTYTTI